MKEELVSDVPVATFMSGGIDSPVINAYAKKNKDDIRAFSFKNKYEETLDESMTANELSKIIGLDYTIVRYNIADVPGISDIKASMNRAEVKRILGTDRFSTACDEVFSAGACMAEMGLFQ